MVWQRSHPYTANLTPPLEDWPEFSCMASLCWVPLSRERNWGLPSSEREWEVAGTRFKLSGARLFLPALNGKVGTAGDQQPLRPYRSAWMYLDQHRGSSFRVPASGGLRAAWGQSFPIPRK